MECTFPPVVEIREDPEFHGVMRMDESHWPRCFLWHGWLHLLSGVIGDSLWAASAAEGAGNLLECSLGSYSSRLLPEWEAVARRLLPTPTFGLMEVWWWLRSLVPPLLGLACMLMCPVMLGRIVGGALDELRPAHVGSVDSGGVFVLFRRAEFW